MYIGQSDVSTLMSIGQPLVVDTQTMENSCIQVMNVYRIFLYVVTKVVSFSVHDTTLDTGTRHPLGIAAWMMVATVVCHSQTALTVDSPAEFTTPNYKRVLEHASLLEVLN